MSDDIVGRVRKTLQRINTRYLEHGMSWEHCHRDLQALIDHELPDLLHEMEQLRAENLEMAEAWGQVPH